MRTVQLYIDAYKEARRLRVGTAKQSPVERAGFYLLASAGETAEGVPSPSYALRRALLAGDIATAMELEEGLFQPSDGSWMASWRGPGNLAVSGALNGAG